jgi:DNA polymerase-3 subunit delta'
MHWTVVGHDAQKALFERLLNGGTMEHAYLFTGPEGVGKRLCADDIIRALHVGQAETEQNPDHMMLAPGISPDTGKPTDIAVEDVRTMKAWAYQRPLYGSVKTVLVDAADRLGDAAANTFLKVLEEPPAYLRFLLVTSQPGRLIGTVQSRCQEVAFSVLSEAQMDTVLGELRLDNDDRALLHAVAAGRPGIALALVRDKRLPLVARSIAQYEKLLKAGVTERLVSAKALADDDDMQDVVAWWLSWTHAQLGARPQLARAAHGLLELASAIAEPKFNRRLALERFLLELS